LQHGQLQFCHTLSIQQADAQAEITRHELPEIRYDEVISRNVADEGIEERAKEGHHMQKPTEAFRQRLTEAFEQIPLGKAFTWRRTFTEADVTLFCGITGDLNPYHQDELFARESWYGRRIVPGLLTASMITHIGGMVGFLATEMTFEFLAPVYPGETITCTVAFGERDVALRRMVGSARFENQDGAEVLRARFSGFPAQVRLA
jgi:3-hydroxybutyryl-CoA dehydratase